MSWDIKRRLIQVLVAGIKVDTVEEGGVKQSRISVTYRFSEPELPMRVMLTQDYGSGRVIRIPTQPQTIGDHIRRRRPGLKMLQREVAEQLGVDETSVHNWEVNVSSPRIEHMPAVIKFIGYNPLAKATTLAGQLVRHRTALGMSQKQAALEIGVDAGTPAKWERGEREPAGEFPARVKQFLREGEVSDAPRAG